MLSVYKGKILLIVACLFWGLSSSMSSIVLKEIPLNAFVGLRFMIGSFVLMIIFKSKLKNISWKVIYTSMILGFVLWGAFSLEATGIKYIGPVKSSFFISLDNLAIPFLYFFIFRKAVGKKEIINLCIATVGVVLINHTGASFEFNVGIFIALSAALLYAIQVILLEIFVKDSDATLITIFELLFVSALSLCISFLNKDIVAFKTNTALASLIVSGVITCGGAYCLQAFGQKMMNAVNAGTIYCTIPIFAMITSRIILNDRLSGIALWGSFFVITSIALSSYQQSKIEIKNENDILVENTHII